MNLYKLLQRSKEYAVHTPKTYLLPSEHDSELTKGTLKCKIERKFKWANTNTAKHVNSSIPESELKVNPNPVLTVLDLSFPPASSDLGADNLENEFIVKSLQLSEAHGRPTLRNLAQAWNKMLQKELEPTSHVKTDATTAFLASLEEPKLIALADAKKKPPIEILPPGMPSLTAPPNVIKKSNAGATPAAPTLTPPEKPLMFEAAKPVTDQRNSAADKETASANTDATSSQNPDQGNGTKAEVAVGTKAEVADGTKAEVVDGSNADVEGTPNAEQPSSSTTAGEEADVLPSTTDTTDVANEPAEAV